MAFLTCEEEASRFPENFSHLKKAGKEKPKRSPGQEADAPACSGDLETRITAPDDTEKSCTLCVWVELPGALTSSYFEGFLGLGCVYWTSRS